MQARRSAARSQRENTYLLTRTPEQSISTHETHGSGEERNLFPSSEPLLILRPARQPLLQSYVLGGLCDLDTSLRPDGALVALRPDRRAPYRCAVHFVGWPAR